MALARQESDIYIILISDNDDPVGLSFDRLSFQITLQNKDISIAPEFYGGSSYDETIGAKRLSNLRGFRIGIDLSYNLSKEEVIKRDYDSSGAASPTASTFREMFNEIMSAFRNGTFDGGTKNFVKMIVSVGQSNGSHQEIRNDSANPIGFVPSEMSYRQTYTNQIGRFIPSIKLESEELITQIRTELEGIV